MAHELEFNSATQSWSFAFSPVEGPGWHTKGRSVADDASPQEWRTAAGHLFTVSKRPVLYARTDGEVISMPDRFVMARDDNQHAMGVVSDQYVIAQPSEVDDICDQFAGLADGQLCRSSAFTLRQGDMICSTYAYRGDGVTIGGDKHKAFLMASTTFDGSGATHFWVSLIRAVCQNTIRAGLATAKGARVSIRHTTKISPERVREQLAELAQSVDQFKQLGDALSQHSMSNAQISAFFKAALDIPAEATMNEKGEVVGTTSRKFNQFVDLTKAFAISKHERNGATDAFTALQAITRYTDHTRSVKVNGSGDETIARFDSSQFGSGDALKTKAWNLLVPTLQERVAAETQGRN